LKPGFVMRNDLSVTRWLQRLRQGDAQAAEVLFRAYFERLVRLARAHLRQDVRRAADEEDVALSALDSFFRGVAANRFPRLHDRHDLWRLLLTITLFKVRDLVNREHRQRRGGGQVVTAADLLDLVDEPGDDLDRLTGPEPPPDLVVAFADQCRHRLEQLPGDDLRQVALARLEGDSVAEAATRLGISRRAVERKLRLIRQIWHDAFAE
jgi:DNA-directed RNA polymerase specialized sigma24 family protein